jgi:predicted O-methyltransferase YrrM
MTSLLTPKKLASLKKLVVQALVQASGPAAEVGVYRGGSARAILQAMDEHRSLYLFDTFAGLPKPGAEDGGFHREGQFAAQLMDVMEYLDPWSAQLHFIVGLFPGTASVLDYLHFSFVHVDVDLYQSVLDCCKWFAPRMSTGGIMVFDDYSAWTTPGCPKAVDEYFGKRVEVTPSGPAVVRF